MKTAIAKVMIIVAAATLGSGCATVRAHKGAVLDAQLVNSLQPGVDNKASVEKLLGRPSFTGQFAANEWYYVARDTRQMVFRNPRVRRQIVLQLQFDPAGNLTKIDHSGKEVVLNLDPASRKTPTLGRKRGFFDELFGNIGTVGSVSTRQ
jgi:outer membrane protein assembly factor BamE (lipoprotein component of BamABCDE complex)